MAKTCKIIVEKWFMQLQHKKIHLFCCDREATVLYVYIYVDKHLLLYLLLRDHFEKSQKSEMPLQVAKVIKCCVNR